MNFSHSRQQHSTHAIRRASRRSSTSEPVAYTPYSSSTSEVPSPSIENERAPGRRGGSCRRAPKDAASLQTAHGKAPRDAHTCAQPVREKRTHAQSAWAEKELHGAHRLRACDGAVASSDSSHSENMLG
eukprot:829020-Pleurochrysis_carterae.AAC.1